MVAAQKVQGTFQHLQFRPLDINLHKPDRRAGGNDGVELFQPNFNLFHLLVGAIVAAGFQATVTVVGHHMLEGGGAGAVAECHVVQVETGIGPKLVPQFGEEVGQWFKGMMLPLGCHLGQGFQQETFIAANINPNGVGLEHTPHHLHALAVIQVVESHGRLAGEAQPGPGDTPGNKLGCWHDRGAGQSLFPAGLEALRGYFCRHDRTRCSRNQGHIFL